MLLDPNILLLILDSMAFRVLYCVRNESCRLDIIVRSRTTIIISKMMKRFFSNARTGQNH